MFDLIPLLVASGLEDQLATEADTLAGQFGLSWTFFIAQCINFLVLAAILWFLAFKPITKTLEERRAKIADGLQFAEEMKSRLADTEKQVAEKLKLASEEAAGLIQEARTNAAAFVEKQKQDAIHSAEGIISKAREGMAQERQQMLNEIREEVAQLVVQTSAKVLRRQLSPEEKSRFSDDAAQEVYQRN